MKKTTIPIDKNGKLLLPEWAWKGLYKQSGSKATSESGIRRAVRKEFLRLLREAHKRNMDIIATSIWRDDRT